MTLRALLAIDVDDSAHVALVAEAEQWVRRLGGYLYVVLLDVGARPKRAHRTPCVVFNHR